MNKVHVIVNPFSARGKTGERWESIKEAMRHYFQEFKYIFTEAPNQATDIARELLQDGFDLIIGVGGDGTLNEITNGFFCNRSHTAINEDASLGIIPSGTGSDFIRFMKIPGDFKKSVQLIKHSRPRKFDVGKVTFLNRTDGDVSKYFINVSDFGLGAEVIKTLSTVPSGKRGPFSYYCGLLSTIKDYRSRAVRIVLDGREEVEGRFLIGAVANGRIFGGGMIIAPEAEADDGFFDLMLIEDMKRLEIIRKSHHLYTGKLMKQAKVKRYRARTIEVFPVNPGEGKAVNIEYDGELGLTLPARFQLLPSEINFRL